MNMHLLTVSQGPSVLLIPTATATHNLPRAWCCSVSQFIAHRASTLEARWPQINPRGLCVGLQTPHCCTRVGPHARAGVANRLSSGACCVELRAWAISEVRAAAAAADSDV
jgi:hypothetical protein